MRANALKAPPEGIRLLSSEVAAEGRGEGERGHGTRRCPGIDQNRTSLGFGTPGRLEVIAPG